MESKPEENFLTDQSEQLQANDRSENSNGSDYELNTVNYPSRRMPFQTNKFSKSSNPTQDGSKKLMRKSSMPAISQIGHSETTAGKILWILVLVAVILGYVFHVINFTNYYLEYPVMVNLNVETLQEFDFPAITICNWNRMRELFEPCVYPHYPENHNYSPLECYKTKLFGVASSLNPMFSRKGPPMVMSDRKLHFSAEKLNNLTEAQIFLIAYFSTSQEFRTKVSMHPSKFIKSCSFHGKNCSWHDFDATLTYRYGVCYTFNQRDSDLPLQTRQAGFEGGLELSLNFDVDEYIEHTPVVGGRVIIHHRTEIPEIEEEGISVSPGIETSIALRQELIKRLPDPYKDQCRDYSSEEQPSSQKECTKSCIQEFSHNKCGCADPTLRSLRLSLCDLGNKTQMQCLDQALMDLSVNSVVCDCPLPCLSVVYRELLSYSKFPSKEFYFSSRETERGFAEEARYQSGKRNFGKVNIFYLNFDRKTLEQRPVFDDSELFSNLGGELDLWLGISLFALFELTEIIFHFCIHVFEYARNRSRKNNVSVTS